MAANHTASRHGAASGRSAAGVAALLALPGDA